MGRLTKEFKLTGWENTFIVKKNGNSKIQALVLAEHKSKGKSAFLYELKLGNTLNPKEHTPTVTSQPIKDLIPTDTNENILTYDSKKVTICKKLDFLTAEQSDKWARHAYLEC